MVRHTPYWIEMGAFDPHEDDEREPEPLPASEHAYWLGDEPPEAWLRAVDDLACRTTDGLAAAAEWADRDLASAALEDLRAADQPRRTP